MNDVNTLVAGIMFGSIGMAYLVYGVKRRRNVALVCGILLSTVPWFVPILALNVFLGVLLVIVPMAYRG
ncbi:hypothetical protein QQM79_03345 [Marinobacteraceae bacterium S3BR75-40.1]